MKKINKESGRDVASSADMREREARRLACQVSNNREAWQVNTRLCVDLKTLLRSCSEMTPGRTYQGTLKRDVECEEFRYDEHYTFTETLPLMAGKRNPHIFDGKYITVTRRDDGSLRLNFKELKTCEDFDLERYALGVYNEICLALAGLIEEV